MNPHLTLRCLPTTKQHIPSVQTKDMGDKKREDHRGAALSTRISTPRFPSEENLASESFAALFLQPKGRDFSSWEVFCGKSSNAQGQGLSHSPGVVALWAGQAGWLPTLGLVVAWWAGAAGTGFCA